MIDQLLERIALSSSGSRLGFGSRVNLLRCIRPRGSSFSRVYIVGRRGTIRSRYQAATNSIVEESKSARLLYVGMTRAGERLILRG